jgi:hypothetical protein
MDAPRGVKMPEGVNAGIFSAVRACEMGRRVVLARDLRRFMVPMMSRCRGCRDTVKRVKRAWRGNTVAMMHYRRIVKSRGGSGETGWAADRWQSSSFTSRPLGMSLG